MKEFNKPQKSDPLRNVLISFDDSLTTGVEVVKEYSLGENY